MCCRDHVAGEFYMSLFCVYSFKFKFIHLSNVSDFIV